MDSINKLKNKQITKTSSVKKAEYISKLMTYALTLTSKSTRNKEVDDISSTIHVISLVTSLIFRAKQNIKSNGVELTTDETIDLIVELLHPVIDKLHDYGNITDDKHIEITKSLDEIDDKSEIIASIIDIVHGASMILIKSTFWKRNCL